MKLSAMLCTSYGAAYITDNLSQTAIISNVFCSNIQHFMEIRGRSRNLNTELQESLRQAKEMIKTTTAVKPLLSFYFRKLIFLFLMYLV